jgi:hypothetical protein
MSYFLAAFFGLPVVSGFAFGGLPLPETLRIASRKEERSYGASLF